MRGVEEEGDGMCFPPGLVPGCRALSTVGLGEPARKVQNEVAYFPPCQLAPGSAACPWAPRHLHNPKTYLSSDTKPFNPKQPRNPPFYSSRTDSPKKQPTHLDQPPTRLP